MRLRLVFLALVVSLCASAAVITQAAGTLTGTSINDPGTLAFVGIDIRGDLALDVDGSIVALLDDFSAPDPGNLFLAGLNVPDDGNIVLYAFNPATLTLGAGFITVVGSASPLVGTPSTAQQVLIDTPLLYTFAITGTTEDPTSGLLVSDLALTSVGAAAVPEPATVGLAGSAIGLLFLMRHRRRRTPGVRL